MISHRILKLMLLAAASVAGVAPASAARIVFLIGEREYETARTLPAFAETHLKAHECVFLTAEADDQTQARNRVPGMEAVDAADLLVISLRRRALPAADLGRIRDHVAAGRPVVSMRTGNHAFSLKGKEPPAGHATWEAFDTDVLGGRYTGHLKPDGSRVTPVAPAGVSPFNTAGTLYEVVDLAADVTVWATGTPLDESTPNYPVLWSRTTAQGGRVVSTTLGHPSAFERPEFTTLLARAIDWALVGR